MLQCCTTSVANLPDPSTFSVAPCQSLGKPFINQDVSRWVGPKSTLLSNYTLIVPTEVPLRLLRHVKRKKACRFSLKWDVHSRQTLAWERRLPACIILLSHCDGLSTGCWQKAPARGLLSWTHPSASRPLEDICTSSVPQAQWGFDMRQKAPGFAHQLFRCRLG